jgi:hypothetical protein
MNVANHSFNPFTPVSPNHDLVPFASNTQGSWTCHLCAAYRHPTLHAWLHVSVIREDVEMAQY